MKETSTVAPSRSASKVSDSSQRESKKAESCCTLIIPGYGDRSNRRHSPSPIEMETKDLTEVKASTSSEDRLYSDTVDAGFFLESEVQDQTAKMPQSIFGFSFNLSNTKKSSHMSYHLDFRWAYYYRYANRERNKDLFDNGEEIPIL